MRSTGISVILEHSCFIFSTLATNISMSKTPIFPLDVQNTSDYQWWTRKVNTLTRLHSLGLLEQEILKNGTFWRTWRKIWRKTERQSKLQKIPILPWYDIVFALLVSGYAVLGELLKYPNDHLSFSSSLSPLLTFLFPQSKPWMLVFHITLSFDISLLILQILKLYLVDLTYLLLLLL